jgi:hypothetical protein
MIERIPSGLASRHNARRGVDPWRLRPAPRRRGSRQLVLTFKIRGRRVVEIDLVADTERLRHLELAVLDDNRPNA